MKNLFVIVIDDGNDMMKNRQIVNQVVIMYASFILT